MANTYWFLVWGKWSNALRLLFIRHLKIIFKEMEFSSKQSFCFTFSVAYQSALCGPQGPTTALNESHSLKISLVSWVQMYLLAVYLKRWMYTYHEGINWSPYYCFTKTNFRGALISHSSLSINQRPRQSLIHLKTWYLSTLAGKLKNSFICWYLLSTWLYMWFSAQLI